MFVYCGNTSQKVEKELDRLEEGVIVPVQHSDWADWADWAVPVLKANGTVRICGDYKLTANMMIKTELPLTTT